MKKIAKKSLFKFILLLISISIENSPIYGQNSSVYHQNPILGFIDGKQVTFEDVRNKKTNDLSLQLYKQLSVRLMEYSIKKLAKRHSEINLTPKKKVTLKEIISFFEQNNLHKRGTLDQLRPQIKIFLQQPIHNQHLLDQYSLALEKGWVVSHLKPPSELLLVGNIKTGYLRGNKKSSVILL